MKRVSVRLGDPSFDLIPLIAHDLRTPITAIKGLSQLALRRADLPSPAVQYLAAVVEEANQIAAVVDDLVLARRLERGETRVLRTKVDLIALLRNVAENAYRFDGIPRPVLFPSAEPVVGECDPNVLTRATLHLLKVISHRAKLDESVSMGASQLASGAEIWIAAMPQSSTAPTSDGVPTLEAIEVADQIDFEGFDVPNLSVYIAAKLAEVQGAQILCDEPPACSARFHVVLSGARDS